MVVFFHLSTFSIGSFFNHFIHYILYRAFVSTQSALHRRGESFQPPAMSSIYLDDATAAILLPNAQQTPAY